jgi:ATP-dependent protease ClpP protease subunit
MSLKNKAHSELFQPRRPKSYACPEPVIARWNPDIQAKDADDESTINMYGQIGEDWWTGEGMTAKIVSAVLRKNKGKAVTVNINSPGGDFFEGNAIYNLLLQHDAEVNVRVIGLAASAASLIACAGDTIEIAESGFFMIHEAWTIVMGNKSDMRDCADFLEKIDGAQAGVYVKQTGMDEKEIFKMIKATTWIEGKEAVEMGFATGLLGSDAVGIDEKPKTSQASALRKAEDALAKAGMPRSERRDLLKALTSGKPGAVEEPAEAKPSAGLKQELNELINIFKQ